MHCNTFSCMTHIHCVCAYTPFFTHSIKHQNLQFRQCPCPFGSYMCCIIKSKDQNCIYIWNYTFYDHSLDNLYLFFYYSIMLFVCSPVHVTFTSTVRLSPWRVHTWPWMDRLWLWMSRLWPGMGHLWPKKPGQGHLASHVRVGNPIGTGLVGVVSLTGRHGCLLIRRKRCSSMYIWYTSSCFRLLSQLFSCLAGHHGNGLASAHWWEMGLKVRSLDVLYASVTLSLCNVYKCRIFIYLRYEHWK